MVRTYILISGSRHLRESFKKGRVCKFLKELKTIIGPGLTIIHGDCPKGIDAVVDYYCKKLSIDKIKYPANWEKYKNSAGPIRNKLMLDHGWPEFVICIYNSLKKKSPGTRNMEELSVQKSFPCFVMDINDLHPRLIDNTIDKLREMI